MPKKREQTLMGRMTNLFVSHPQTSYNKEALHKIFPETSLGTIGSYLHELQKRKGVQGAVILHESGKRGYYILNPGYKTLDQIQSRVIEHITTNGNGATKIISGAPFDPTKPAISTVDPAVILKQLFFSSMVERMSKSPQFSLSDVEFIKKECPHLVKQG